MTRAVANDTSTIFEQIVDGVAALENTDPLELPPLYDAVDPDALASLFATTNGGGSRAGHVTFLYAGHTITIEFDEEPTITID